MKLQTLGFIAIPLALLCIALWPTPGNSFGLTNTDNTK